MRGDVPEVPESILSEMRHCLKSAIHCDSPNLLPDYYCRQNFKLCRLYKVERCSQREDFLGLSNT